MHYGTNIYKAYLEFIETFDDHWNIISSEAQKTTIATKQAIVKLQHTQESDIASRNSLYGSENVDYLDLKIMSQYADLDALDEKYFEQSQNLYTLIQEAVAHIDPSYINLLVFFREELGVNQAIKTANAAHAQW